ncbi:MAG TPA: DEAD/DEAH box helicase [Tepidisphaeraceae bacterium]|nr:DEAD/DEAH box helicase [Tepidisphaeraceae bacterium]
MSFQNLALSAPILRAVESEGYRLATPVQTQAIPHALRGRDLLACAQTGTGKTAAFALPILHRLSSAARHGGLARPRCLVLCPTRELARQIGDSFRAYGRHVGLSCAVVFGGVGIGPQADVLRRGVDILIATPGRLLDLLSQRMADLRNVEILVLDEADRMLDMGFIADIRRIIAVLPARRQTMLFSATMPPEIRTLAAGILRDPANVQVAAESAVADRIDQSVYFVSQGEKPALLARLFNDLPMTRAVVFTRTKRGADRLVQRLHASGIRSEAIHANKSQNARQRALQNFQTGKTSLLIATDIASRGIDVDQITHVVNYDLSAEPETYVHRIGRTARAGASGVAISFCNPDELPHLKAVEKLIRRTIPVRKGKTIAQQSRPAIQHVKPQVPAHRQPHPQPAQPQPPRHQPQTARYEHPRHPMAKHSGPPAHPWRRTGPRRTLVGAFG